MGEEGEHSDLDWTRISLSQAQTCSGSPVRVRVTAASEQAYVQPDKMAWREAIARVKRHGQLPGPGGLSR